MSISLAEKIRAMTRYIDNKEVIAKTLDIDVDIIEGIINGEIPDELLEGYNPAKPPEIKVIEQKKFIRSRTIGIISADSEGSLLTSTMGAKLANRVTYDVAIADFNELPVQAVYLGINNKEYAAHINFIYGENDNFKDKGAYHPEIKNLSIFTAATNATHHQELTADRMVSLLADISANYSVVFIDCPTGLQYWGTLIPYLDFVIMGVEQTPIGLNRYLHIYDYLNSINVLDRTSVILLSGESSEPISANEAKRYIGRDIPVLGVLNYSSAVKQAGAILKHSKFINGTETILDELFPDTKKREGKGFLKAIFK